MTVRHMKIFVQVYRTLNITQAAKELHMTQPAVTRVIQEIEQYYGVRLFERINRRLSPTECGKTIYSQALHIVDAFDTMETGLRNWDAFGVLRVGASTTLGNFFLPEIVSQFQEENSDIKVRVTISNGDSLQRALCDNQLDIALIEGTIQRTELHTQAFRKDCLDLIMPPNHPLLTQKQIWIKNLLKFPFLLREKGSAGRAVLDNFFAIHEITIQPMWESTSTQALIKAVSLGLGISFLPQQVVKQAVESGVVCTKNIVDADFTRQHYLVWHKNKYLSKALLNFIALCQKNKEQII